MYLRKSGNFQECWYPKTSLQITDENALLKFEIRFYTYGSLGILEMNSASINRPIKHTHTHLDFFRCAYICATDYRHCPLLCVHTHIMSFVRSKPCGASQAVCCVHLVFIWRGWTIFSRESMAAWMCAGARVVWESWHAWVFGVGFFSMGSDVSHIEW